MISNLIITERAIETKKKAKKTDKSSIPVFNLMDSLLQGATMGSVRLQTIAYIL